MRLEQIKDRFPRGARFCEGYQIFSISQASMTNLEEIAINFSVLKPNYWYSFLNVLLSCGSMVSINSTILFYLTAYLIIFYSPWRSKTGKINHFLDILINKRLTVPYPIRFTDKAAILIGSSTPIPSITLFNTKQF